MSPVLSSRHLSHQQLPLQWPEWILSPLLCPGIKPGSLASLPSLPRSASEMRPLESPWGCQLLQPCLASCRCAAPSPCGWCSAPCHTHPSSQCRVPASVCACCLPLHSWVGSGPSLTLPDNSLAFRGTWVCAGVRMRGTGLACGAAAHSAQGATRPIYVPDSPTPSSSALGTALAVYLQDQRQWSWRGAQEVAWQSRLLTHWATASTVPGDRRPAWPISLAGTLSLSLRRLPVASRPKQKTH